MNITYLKTTAILLVSVVIFSSCLSSKTLTNSIKSNIGKELADVKKIDASNIILKTVALTKMDSLVTVDKNKSYFIPAIVFWVWENSLNCKLNNQIYTNTFIDILNYKIAEFQLSKQLGNKVLEIDITNIPSAFSYTKKGFFYFIFYAYGYSFYEGIQPDGQTFEIRYRILEDNFEIKNKTFKKFYDAPYKDGWAGSSNLVNKYIQSLNANFENDCNEFLSEIIDNL
jgi:hypothetical protein